MIVLSPIIVIVFVALFAIWIQYRWRNRRFFELAKKLPGHDGFSFIGSIKLLRETFIDNYSLINRLLIEGLPITKLFVFDYLIIMTKDADVINQVLNMPQTYDKPEIIYQGFPVKKGILILNGDEHIRHRKILNRAFVPKMLERLPQFFDRAARKMLSKISDKVDCGEFDILQYVGAYTMESFGITNFCYETKYYTNEFHDAHERSSRVMMESLIYYVLGLNQNTTKWTNTGKEMAKFRMVFLNYYNAVVKNYCGTKNPERNTVIDLLLDPANEFDEIDISDECQTMLFAALDTTSRTLATILMMLGIHEEVQQQLIDEINTIYNECNNNNNFDFEFLQKFKFLEAVINESMRLYTIAPYTLRKCTEEVNINGYLIPKDAIIAMSNDGMHRDEKYWGSDAHLFRPERFLKELKYPKAFRPFSGGRRMCIGYRYAMISMKIVLINFLRTYKVECSTKFEDIKLEILMTLNFVDGYKISIQKRN